MPDLSAVLDFSIALDLVQGKIIVTDTSTYPAGVGVGVVGIVSTQQPDQIPVTGNWNTPDVIYASSASGMVELRKRPDNLPQQGNYSVTYQVDHPSYSPTTKTKTFNLAYLGVTPVITPLFDVFTPTLSVRDDATYNYGGFNAPVVTRAWNAVIGNQGSVAGSAQSQSLAINSNYYDATYAITLTVNLTYVHSTYTWLTVVDRKAATLNTQANTPPTFTVLKGYLKTIKANFDNAQQYQLEQFKEDYAFAGTLLSQIKSRICGNDLVGLYDQIQDFLNVYHQHVSVNYVNTNTPISAYSYADVDCGTGTGSTTDSRISTSDIINWNTAYSAIALDDVEVRVGVDSGAPTVGASTWTSASFAGRRVRFYINRIKQATIQENADYFFSKPKVSDTLTMTGYQWITGDLLQIEFY